MPLVIRLQDANDSGVEVEVSLEKVLRSPLLTFFSRMMTSFMTTGRAHLPPGQ